MKNRPSQLGLIVEGNTTQSALLRLHKLGEVLGPVKSTMPSTARRFSNAIRGGYPVADYEGLQDASLILIRVPDSALSRVVGEVAASGLSLRESAFVLCESWQGVKALDALRQKGAHAATIMRLPVDQRDWFVAEGDSKAVRPTRRFLQAQGCTVTELNQHGKHFLFASQLLISALPVPLFVAAQQALRESGFSGNLLTNLMEQMLMRSVRDVMLGAKSRWGGPLLESSEPTVEAHLDALAALRPEMGAFINEQLALARNMMRGKR